VIASMIPDQFAQSDPSNCSSLIPVGIPKVDAYALIGPDLWFRQIRRRDPGGGKALAADPEVVAGLPCGEAFFGVGQRDMVMRWFSVAEEGSQRQWLSLQEEGYLFPYLCSLVLPETLYRVLFPYALLCVYLI